MSNRVMIAAAGAGKTTFLITEALKIPSERVLITTFTNANELEIRKKFVEMCGSIPANITIQTWFSFLLQHGVRPYQSVIIDSTIKGFKLVNQKSGLRYKGKAGPVYWGEKDPAKYYFSNSMDIYSDKIAKFVCKANELSGGKVIDRISRIFQYIFIDEIQDLAGYDLEIIKQLLLTTSDMLMVGDPRQVTYHTHEEAKYSNYSDGKIEDFILNECKDISVLVDKKTLSVSHRSQEKICTLANEIYPDYPPCSCDPKEPTGHDGVFFVHPGNIDLYLATYKPVQLRDKITVPVNPQYMAVNFGESKGLTFDRVLIYPTAPMLDWLRDHSKELKPKSRSKLYVAVTRARYSVGIVFDNKKGIAVPGIETYAPNP